MISGSHTVLIRTISPVGHGAEASSSAGHRTLTRWSCSIKSWHMNTSFQTLKQPMKRVQGMVQSDKLKHLTDPLLLQFVEPFLKLVQLFSKIIRPFFKKANLFFFGWRSPWWNGCSVPPGMTTPPSTVPISRVSPSCRSHTVWHSYHSLLPLVSSRKS